MIVVGACSQNRNGPRNSGTCPPDRFFVADRFWIASRARQRPHGSPGFEETLNVTSSRRPDVDR
eukprot:5942110-Pyramimonas_sp.AAC.1